MSDTASILWDFYTTLGCHDTQNVLHKNNHPFKPIRLICMDGLTKPLYLRRLADRLEPLSVIRWSVSSLEANAWRHKQTIYFSCAPMGGGPKCQNSKHFNINEHVNFHDQLS